eukprot:16449110-Heterocapsa_arctica.AAC.1
MQRAPRRQRPRLATPRPSSLGPPAPLRRSPPPPGQPSARNLMVIARMPEDSSKTVKNFVDL